MKKVFIILVIILVIVLTGLFVFKIKNNFSEEAKAKETKEEVKIAIMTATELNFLDIGQGDSTFIEFKNGEQILVDCGKDAKVLEELGRVMDFRDKSIDYLIVTHPDSDHYGGCIDVLERFEIANVIYNGQQKNEDFYRLVGGGIDFGETGIEALKREVKEEINAEIKNIKYLGLIENIFNYEGKEMHEIALVYKAEFKDKEIYGKKEIKILDSRKPQKAYWLDKKIVFKAKFYPEGLKKLI